MTVEKKEGRLKGRKYVAIMDLPCIYSLSPYTLEEVVARNYLIQEKPDVILNLVDASNIERNLYLTTQLLELGIPVVIALNTVSYTHLDVYKRQGLVGPAEAAVNDDELAAPLDGALPLFGLYWDVACLLYTSTSGWR